VKGVLIALAVIAVLLVGADRAADYAAGRYAADRIAEQTQSAGSVGSVAVNFRGFPFLTQALQRRFGRVDVTVSDAQAGGLRIEQLEARLSEARLQSGDAVRAGSLTGRATVAYAELTDATRGRAQLSYGGPGLIKITRTATVLGRQASVSVVGEPSVRDGVLIVRELRFDGYSGPIGDAVRRLPLGRFEFDVRIPQLPDRIDVDVSPHESGVELRFSGTDVLLQP